MGAFAGSKVTTDNLVFGYDMHNTEKSWLGEPITNLAPYTDYSDKTYNTLYDIGGWGGDDADLYYYPNGGYRNMPYKKMIKHTGGTGGSYRNDHVSFTIENNKTYIVTVYMKASSKTFVNGHAFGLNRNSDNAYRVPGGSYELSTEWQLISWVYVAGADHAGTDYQARQIIYVDANLPVEIYWCGYQVVERDYVVPFVAGTRSTSQSLIDLTGNNTITNNSLTYASDNTFSFNGTSDYLTTSTIPEFTSADVFSISTLVKPTSLAATSFYLTPAGLGIDRFLRLNTNGSFSIQLTEIADSGGRSFTSAAGAVLVDEYAYLTYVVSGTTIKLYKNGILDSSQTDVSGVPCGQWGGYTWTIGQRSNSTFWFTGEIPIVQAYDKALTADEVRQNFNALRGRFGL